MQHSCGSARCQRPCAGINPSHRLRHRSSKVEFNLAAIPPHLCREESRQKCSGQQGHGRPGCWRRHCQFGLRQCLRPSCQRLRGSARISDVAFVLLFEGQCQFAKTVVPRINVCASLTRWAVPSQAPEAVCPRTPPVFVGVWEPKVSQPLHRQSPPTPTPARPPPWPRFTRFARSAPLVVGRDCPHTQASHRHSQPPTPTKRPTP